MLRVAITGGAGSGKSTIAAMFAARGAHVISSDEVARTLMQPGEAVFDEIVRIFGKDVVAKDGTLDRARLAQMAFAEGRVKELEAVVHPAVMQWQTEWFRRMAKDDPKGVAMVESALVFESQFTTVAEERFDRIVLVTASEAQKRERFVERGLKANPAADREKLAADAERRLALQIPDAEKLGRVDEVVVNHGSLVDVEKEVDRVWQRLTTDARKRASNGN